MEKKEEQKRNGTIENQTPEQAVNRWKEYVCSDKQAEFAAELTNLLENVQKAAFRSGYEYAIELLQESLVKVN